MRYLLRAGDDEKSGRVLFDFESLSRAGRRPATRSRSPAQPRQAHPRRGGQAPGRLVRPRERKDTAHGHDDLSRVHDRPPACRSGSAAAGPPGTRVELRVGGRVVRAATGIFEQQRDPDPGGRGTCAPSGARRRSSGWSTKTRAAGAPALRSRGPVLMGPRRAASNVPRPFPACVRRGICQPRAELRCRTG